MKDPPELLDALGISGLRLQGPTASQPRFRQGARQILLEGC